MSTPEDNRTISPQSTNSISDEFLTELKNTKKSAVKKKMVEDLILFLAMNPNYILSDQNFPQFDEGHKAMYLLFLCCVKLGLRIGEGIGIRTNQFLFDERAFVVDGFWKANQLYRTTYNKCGAERCSETRRFGKGYYS